MSKGLIMESDRFANLPYMNRRFQLQHAIHPVVLNRLAGEQEMR